MLCTHATHERYPFAHARKHTRFACLSHTCLCTHKHKHAPDSRPPPPYFSPLSLSRFLFFSRALALSFSFALCFFSNPCGTGRAVVRGSMPQQAEHTDQEFLQVEQHFDWRGRVFQSQARDSQGNGGEDSNQNNVGQRCGRVAALFCCVA